MTAINKLTSANFTFRDFSDLADLRLIAPVKTRPANAAALNGVAASDSLVAARFSAGPPRGLHSSIRAGAPDLNVNKDPLTQFALTVHNRGDLAWTQSIAATRELLSACCAQCSRTTARRSSDRLPEG
jgi:hypothetical protein